MGMVEQGCVIKVSDFAQLWAYSGVFTDLLSLPATKSTAQSARARHRDLMSPPPKAGPAPGSIGELRAEGPNRGLPSQSPLESLGGLKTRFLWRSLFKGFIPHRRGATGRMRTMSAQVGAKEWIIGCVNFPPAAQET